MILYMQIPSNMQNWGAIAILNLNLGQALRKVDSSTTDTIKIATAQGDLSDSQRKEGQSNSSNSCSINLIRTLKSTQRLLF